MPLSRGPILLIGAFAMTLLFHACAKKQAQEPKKAAVVDAKPKIVAVEKQYNFGKVKAGDPVEHVFEIQNQGKGELVIEGAHGSCGCLATVLSATKIAPGGKGQVKASLTTVGRNGRQVKQITVVSNDPVQHQLTITMEGEVYTDIAVTPQYLWLKEVKVGEKASRDFSVAVREPEKVKIASLKVEDQRFAITRKSGDPKGKAEYVLVFKGAKKPESVSTQLVVKSEGESVPAVTVQVRLEVIGDLRYPKMVQVIRREGKPFSVDVSFTSRSKKAFTIKRAEDPNKLLKLEVLENKSPTARVRVQLADENAEVPAGKRFSFFVYTSDRIEPKVEISYSVYGERASAKAERANIRNIVPSSKAPVPSSK